MAPEAVRRGYRAEAVASGRPKEKKRVDAFDVGGTAPRVEVALPGANFVPGAVAADPYLTDWIKTQPGPVKFIGTPCSFPGRVWKSKVGNYWNMLCALDGKSPWARFTSSDPSLMTWKLADKSFTQGKDAGGAAGTKPTETNRKPNSRITRIVPASL